MFRRCMKKTEKNFRPLTPRCKGIFLPFPEKALKNWDITVYKILQKMFLKTFSFMDILCPFTEKGEIYHSNRNITGPKYPQKYLYFTNLTSHSRYRWR